MTETSMNPNVPVGAEATTASKANSAVTFDDVADQKEAPKPRPKLVKDDKEEKEPKTKPVRSGAKDEADSFSEADDDAEPAKAKPKEKSEKDDGKDDKAAPKAAKPKVHKLKSGEQAYDVAGDALVTVTIDGKKEEVKLQDIIDNHSGKTNWDRKFNELRNERTEFTKQRESMNSLVKNLYEKSQKDPEAAWDFLAELNKQDPAKLKIGILRQQFEEMKALYDMDEPSRERWFKEKELDFRDKAHTNREKANSEREAQVAEETSRADAAKKYGIGDDEWANATKLVHQYLSKVDPKFDGKVTPEQVIYGSRQLMALDVINRTVPNLENHEKFDSIVGDIVTDLMRHPGVTREKLASLLQEVWGDENKGLKNLGRKAAKNAQISDDERPARRSVNRDPVTFDDLD